MSDDLATIEMTRECARDLTDRIKTAAQDVAEMLWRAHQGKAWRALGYDSWTAYTAEEFRMSKQHSFRLLDFVEIKQSLKESPRGDSVSEGQLRPLKGVPTEKRAEVFQSAVEAANGEQPTAAQVEEAAKGVKERREENAATPKPAEKAASDSDNMAGLKRYWQRAGKKDRRLFLEWAKSRLLK